MKLSDFDFDLPRELIAQKPVSIRDKSRLLVVNRREGTLSHDHFSNLPVYLKNHPLMVFNDTRVLPAKLWGRRQDTGKEVEVLLIREEPTGTWEAMIKGLGRLKVGAQFFFGDGELEAVLQEKKAGRGFLRFTSRGDFRAVLERVAVPPLPPYIQRGSCDEEDLKSMDRERYQTVYAAKEGAIAAPTAGLHFTRDMMVEIKEEGHADPVFLTLHVGPGTFTPIRAEDDIRRHTMERECFTIPPSTWNRLAKAKQSGQTILAVGTTTTRVLESVELTGSAKTPVSGWTDRFIYPGQEFKNASQLLTNFHLPKSTLFLLVCAFGGPDLMKQAYREAVRERYRFFSYGDAMLIL